MSAQIFEAALGLRPPWFIADLEFDEPARTLTIQVDFQRGSRFQATDAEGEHPVHDTVTKTYRHLSFFQHECHLEVRTPRVKLPRRLGSSGPARLRRVVCLASRCCSRR
jgi:transposase